MARVLWECNRNLWKSFPGSKAGEELFDPDEGPRNRGQIKRAEYRDDGDDAEKFRQAEPGNSLAVLFHSLL